MRLVLCAVFTLMATSVWAQRVVPIQTVFVTYVGNTTHWTDPAVMGPQLNAQDQAFWNGGRGSWGAISLNGSSFPTWVDSTATMNGCTGLGQIGLDVKAAIGFWPPSGSIRHIVLPPGTPCNSQTAGTILGGGSATVYTVGGAFTEHETGHALGLAHAKAKYPDGSTQDYGPYSVMGNATYGDAIRANERSQVIAYSANFSLLTVTTTQDVVLQLSETMTSGIKGVKVSQSGHVVSAEFRGGDLLSTGVIIVLNTVLQTMDPTQQNYWLLKVGKTYCDPGVVCFTTVSETSTTATVHIDIGGTSLPSPINHTR